MGIPKHHRVPEDVQTLLVDADYPAIVRLSTHRGRGYKSVDAFEVEGPDDVVETLEQLHAAVDDLRDPDRDVLVAVSLDDAKPTAKSGAFRWRLTSGGGQDQPAAAREELSPAAARESMPRLVIGEGEAAYVQLAVDALARSEGRAWQEADRANERVRQERQYNLAMMEKLPAVFQRFVDAGITALDARDESRRIDAEETADVAKIEAARDVAIAVLPDAVQGWIERRKPTADEKPTTLKAKAKAVVVSKGKPQQPSVVGLLMTLSGEDRAALQAWYAAHRDLAPNEIEGQLRRSLDSGELTLSDEAVAKLSAYANQPPPPTGPSAVSTET